MKPTLLLFVLTIGACSTSAKHPNDLVGKTNKNELIYQCEHGQKDGVVISCSQLDCSEMFAVSSEQCSVIGKRLLRQSTELAKFASRGEKDQVKVTRTNYGGNVVACTFSPEVPESKTKEEWARYQQMSCFLVAPQ